MMYLPTYTTASISQITIFNLGNVRFVLGRKPLSSSYLRFSCRVKMELISHEASQITKHSEVFRGEAEMQHSYQKAKRGFV